MCVTLVIYRESQQIKFRWMTNNVKWRSSSHCLSSQSSILRRSVAVSNPQDSFLLHSSCPTPLSWLQLYFSTVLYVPFVLLTVKFYKITCYRIDHACVWSRWIHLGLEYFITCIAITITTVIIMRRFRGNLPSNLWEKNLCNMSPCLKWTTFSHRLQVPISTLISFSSCICFVCDCISIYTNQNSARVSCLHIPAARPVHGNLQYSLP